MPINVICRGCLARFTVADKFAGKKGPCPKCKAVIEIPKVEEKVVIHEPEIEAGAKNAAGVSILKPLERKETVINPMLIAGYIAGAVLFLFVAFVLRNLEDKTIMLAIGSLAIAPPLVWGGYCMLRDDEELEPFSGLNLATRVGICSLLYPILWLVFNFLYGRFFGDEPAELWSIVMLAPIILFFGAGIAAACFDFDLGVGFFHYSLYLVVSIVLRLVMGLPIAGPAASPTPTTPPIDTMPVPGGPPPVSWLIEAVQQWIA